MICEWCKGQLHPVTIEEDDEEEATCDSCQSIAVEVSGLGFVCIKTRTILVERGEYGLWHPEDVSRWRRLVWAAAFK